MLKKSYFLIYLVFVILIQVGCQTNRLPPTTSDKPVKSKQPNKAIANFQAAKKKAQQIFQQKRVTFYCNCPYAINGQVDIKACQYKPKRFSRRSTRIEWEHIVPASYFGQTRRCWQEAICKTNDNKFFKGRRCCAKIDPQFRKMESDLHNLVPAIGEINAARSNFPFAIINAPHLTGTYGACSIKIDRPNRRVEPREAIRGVIARSWLYMSNTYQLPLSKQQRTLYQRWHKAYPPSAWEKNWNLQVAKIQGNINPYISN